jgi:hypothetical protein
MRAKQGIRQHPLKAFVVGAQWFARFPQEQEATPQLSK